MLKTTKGQAPKLLYDAMDYVKDVLDDRRGRHGLSWGDFDAKGEFKHRRALAAKERALAVKRKALMLERKRQQALNREKRSRAAIKGWETRRANELLSNEVEKRWRFENKLHELRQLKQDYGTSLAGIELNPTSDEIEQALRQEILAELRARIAKAEQDLTRQ